MPKSGKEGIKVSPLVQEITAFLQAHIHEDDNLGRRLKFDYGDAGVVYIDGSQRPNVVHNRPEPADCTVYLAPDVHWRMLHLELDQPPGETLFRDSSPAGQDGTCTETNGNGCPARRIARSSPR